MIRGVNFPVAAILKQQRNSLHVPARKLLLGVQCLNCNFDQVCPRSNCEARAKLFKLMDFHNLRFQIWLDDARDKQVGFIFTSHIENIASLRQYYDLVFSVTKRLLNQHCPSHSLEHIYFKIVINKAFSKNFSSVIPFLTAKRLFDSLSVYWHPPP